MSTPIEEPYAGIAETHSGVVVFLGDRAYKVRKPLQFAFADFSTVAARRRACEEEVRLNRRLAPDVYLGVGSLAGPPRAGPAGDAPDTDAEPVVIMRRLPVDRRLSTLLRAGDAEACVDSVAARLAEFHAGAPSTDVACEVAGVQATA